jgi:hypothetical protein
MLNTPRQRFTALLIALAAVISITTHTNTFMAVVLPDRVSIGAEFIPRRTDLPNKLIVNAGVTFELPATATYDYVENAGTLRVSRTHNTSIKFTTLINLPGAVFDVGTQSDPIPCNIRVDLSIRDVPIDKTKDPFSWGNGLVNFGKQTRIGCAKTPWVEAAGGIAEGANSITLAAAPSGWLVGDALLIPDTTSPNVDPQIVSVQRETPVTIASIAGSVITLSKPLDFAHPNIVDMDGVLVLRPRVANLTRNIVIRSENANGTPGHTADIGHGSSWDIRANQFVELGRTTIDPLDDTVLGSHVGTNQRGKYAEHHHHAESSPGSADVDNTYIGRGGNIGAKWGVVLHNTSDTLIEGDIVTDFPGACYSTEDGYEVRNVFRKNMAAYCLGHTRDAQGNVFDAAGNLARLAPGAEGTGFWLHGVMNTFIGNEAWNNFTSGFNLMNQSQPTNLYPSTPGGPSDTPLNHFFDNPIAFTDNIVAGNVVNGIEMWGLGRNRFPYTNLIAANNGSRQVFPVNSDGIAVYFVNPKVICAPHTGATGFHSSMGYVEQFEAVDGQVDGCAIGLSGGGGSTSMYFTRTKIRAELAIDMLTRNVRFDNMLFLPFENLPHQYIMMGTGAIWHSPDPLPQVGVSMWVPARGSQIIAKNWQGTGQDFQLFYLQSLANNEAWYSSSAEGVHAWNCPVVGLTMGRTNGVDGCWEKFGLSYGGDILQPADAVVLDGIINGRARKGLFTQLGPPRAPVTFPTMRAPATLEGDVVRIYAVNTGDFNVASDIFWLTVDGDDPYPLQKEGTDDRTFTSSHIQPGVHVVRTWRSKIGDASAVVPGSLASSCFFVGPPPTLAQIPADCAGQAPATVTVPNVVGITRALATAAITGNGLLVGLVTQASSSTVPNGAVISQTPLGGAQAMAGSAVNLVMSNGAGQPPPPTCQDPNATNIGGPLPCVYPPPPPVCPPPQTLVNGVCVAPPSALLPPGVYRLCDASNKCVTFVVQ